ncbi:MAG TPA: VWA domain-containing protein, partial [Clostridiaceae bacterium]|nr:VWA domain-containing protein [Clostridiaceae bacterium]
MGGTSGRMAAAKTAAKSFIDYMIQNDPNLRIGIVSFANDASQDRTYSRNRTDLKNAVDGLTATGGTHTQAGLYTARTLMNTSTADRRFIVFLSDGEPTYSYEPVNWSNPTETLPGYYFDDGAKGNFTYKNYYAIYDGNHTTTRVGSGNLIRSSTATHNGSRYWPQEVGGTVYYPLDRSGNSNNRTYTAKNLYYVDNGLAAVRAASDTKGDAGFSGLFTIALSAGTEGTSILEQIATSPSMAYATGNPADLQSIYDAIGLEIATQHAINNAVITDEMGDGFQLISGSIAVTEGTTSVAPAGGGKNQTITWTISPYVSARIGTSDVRFAEMTYRIEITPGILTATPSTPAADPEHNLFLTNKSTDMTYKNFNGTPATAAFISPQVDPVLLKIKKILTDAQGNVIPTDPRLFNVKIEKAPVFAHTENLVVGADYVWLTTLRHEGRYDVTEIGVDGSPATLDQFDIYYTVDGTEGQDYFDVFHQTGGIPRGDITIVVRNRENAVRVSFNGSKTLTGRTDASVADSFKFKLTALNGAKMPASDEVTLTFNGNGTQNFSFGPIIYTLSDLGGQNSKVLTYEISEIKPSPGIPGIVYDSSLVRTVTVTLTKNAAGLIQASVSPASVSFDNSYGAGGSFLPAATKTLTGRNLAAGEFTFHLEKLIPGSSPQAWTMVESKTNLADGTIPFAAIHYTTADLGVHTYRIREDAAVPGGISHDPLEIIYTVTVTDNKDGSLNVAYSVPADTEFNNFYMASGSFTPQVTKALAGRPLENGEFSFQLRDGDGTLLQTVSNLAGGQVIFSAIPYTQADIGRTFTYTIKEVVPTVGENGMTYDPLVVTIQVQVTDAGNGELAITPVYSADTEFNNVYVAEGSFQPTVRKVLAGRELAAGEFTFALKRNGTVLQTKTNAADGTVTFDPILYTQDDIGQTYAYTIVEVVPGSPETGMSYDALVVTITVDIADAGHGALTVTPHYPADTEFDNAYAASGSWNPQVTKKLEGRVLKNGEFSFLLKDVGGNVLQTKTNTAGGQVIFDAVSYSQADIGKTFTYTIEEVVPATPESGMTYDPMILTVTVQVTDVGNGQLAITPGYPADTEFNNVYTAQGSFTPTVRKVLAGRVLAAGEFTFALKRNGTVLQTKTNAADGTVTFDPIPYGQDDIGQTYTYTIVEVVPGSPETGMTYDALVVTITVDIEDAGGGLLTVTPHYPADTEFNNAFTASGSWTPQVTKTLEGRTLKNGEFSFQLKDEDGNVLQTKTNAAGGQVVFDAVNYSQADIGKTFTYTIEEVVPATPENGMIYDPMILTVTVQVTDAGNGQLAITPVYPADTEFNNVYAAQGSFTPIVRKVLAGRELAAGEFTFALKRNGTVLQTKTNAADGTVTFDPIHYTQDDIGQTYAYTIIELVPGSPETGMTYDALVV